MMSLPDYRDADLQFYWPPSTTNPTLCRVDKFEVKENPNREFRRFDQMVQRTEKSQIWSVALLTEAGNQEHVALKLVPCAHAANSKKFKETIKNEYDVLAGLNHKHIIAPVGSYVEGEPGAWYYGLLLFPLAPYSLRMLLVEVSEHNGVRSKLPNPVEWKIDKRSTQLLDYFACLCQAVIYLHTQKKPIKHRDIKCDNVLVDKHGTVILADFDIAKQYTTMAFVVTTGTTSFTPETAPQSVKDGRKRGLESDVFSLGCVFLETASVAFGETLQAYGQHLCGGKAGTCYHSDALKSGTIDTWIDRLKAQASLCPQIIPTGHFGKTGDVGEDTEEFLDMISAMLHVKLGDDQEALLASAWRCFSKFSTKACQHCCPGGAKVGILIRRRSANQHGLIQALDRS
jgi:serine/threonine protein kinase